MSTGKLIYGAVLLAALLFPASSGGAYAQDDDSVAFELVAMTTGLSKGGYEQSQTTALFTRLFVDTFSVLVISSERADDAIINQDLTHIYLNAQAAGLAYRACGIKLTPSVTAKVDARCKSPQLVILYKEQQADEPDAKTIIESLDFGSNSTKAEALDLVSKASRDGLAGSCMSAVWVKDQKILGGIVIVDDRVTAGRSLCFLTFAFHIFGVTPYIAPVAEVDKQGAFFEMYGSKKIGPNAHTALQFLYSNLVIQGMSPDQYLEAAYRWLDQHKQ